MTKVDYPRLRDLPIEEQQEFSSWLWGQTRPWIDNLPMEEQDAYYPWDYERWKDKLPVID